MSHSTVEADCRTGVYWSLFVGREHYWLDALACRPRVIWVPTLLGFRANLSSTFWVTDRCSRRRPTGREKALPGKLRKRPAPGLEPAPPVGEVPAPPPPITPPIGFTRRGPLGTEGLIPALGEAPIKPFGNAERGEIICRWASGPTSLVGRAGRYGRIYAIRPDAPTACDWWGGWLYAHSGYRRGAWSGWRSGARRGLCNY